MKEQEFKEIAKETLKEFLNKNLDSTIIYKYIKSLEDKIHMARLNILKDISIIKNRNISQKEIIQRLEESIKILGGGE